MPLEILKKCLCTQCNFIFLCRQMVARSLLDTLREVCDDERDCIAVLERISRLADDSGMLMKRKVSFPSPCF